MIDGLKTGRSAGMGLSETERSTVAARVNPRFNESAGTDACQNGLLTVSNVYAISVVGADNGTARSVGQGIFVAMMFVASSLIPVSSAIAQSSAAHVLTDNRAAMHTPSHGRLDVQYTFSGLGLTGTAGRTIDLASGSFIENTVGGPLSVGAGYDGKIPWMKDFSGTYTREEGGDRIPLAVNQAYRFANLWWQPRYAGAQVIYLGRDVNDGQAADHLVVTPRGGKAFDAWFDVRSHLLLRIRELQGFMTTQVFFSNYGKINGLLLPRETTLDLGSGPTSYITLTLHQAAARAALPVFAYACPTIVPTDVAIEGGKPMTELGFKLLNNHIYVPVFVNGHGPYTFIVDTGGHLAISPHLATELGTASAGAAPASGAGEKLSSTGFSQVDEVAVGDVHLYKQTAFVIEVYDAAVEGIPVDGMLGFELFRRLAIKIDYQHQILTFTDPTYFMPRDAGVLVPFKFYDHLPDVAGLLDGVRARFDIDTGSRAELDVTSPFVKREGLHAQYPHALQAVTGWGVGGPVSSSVVRLASLTLGSVRVARPIAELSDSMHGSFSDSNYEGNVGSGLLKRFIVTFDYSKQRLFLKPVQPLPPDVGTFDKSGLWFNADASGYMITSIDRGGPAEESGLQRGDMITAIDGRPAAMEDLSEVRERLRTEPAGTVLRFEVLRGDERRLFDVTLQDLVAPYR